MKKPTVFLSYSRANVDEARALVDQLQLNGLQVWWDSHLQIGTNFSEEIDAAVDRCDVAIVLLSKYYLSSKYCQEESKLILESSKKLIPIVVDGSELPSWLRPLQRIYLSGKQISDEQCAELVEALEDSKIKRSASND